MKNNSKPVYLGSDGKIHTATQIRDLGDGRQATALRAATMAISNLIGIKPVLFISSESPVYLSFDVNNPPPPLAVGGGL